MTPTTTELKIAVRYRSRRRVVVVLHGAAIIKEFPVKGAESDQDAYMRVMALAMSLPEFRGVTRTSTETGDVLTDDDIKRGMKQGERKR
jgi:hypothetical protein